MAFSKNRIGVPFGNSNAAIDLPLAAQPDGSESRETGYTSAHETKVSLGGKPLQRSILNQILKETQGAIKDIQNTGTPPWFNQADNNGVLMNYAAGAQVWHVGVEWISTIDNNNTEPGAPGASWIRTSQIMDRIFINDDVLTTSRALTISDINKHLTIGSAAPATFTLPLANSLPSGSAIFICNTTTNVSTTINVNGTDTINDGTTSALIKFGTSGIFVSNGFGSWRLSRFSSFSDLQTIRSSSAPSVTTATYLRGVTYTNTTGAAFMFKAAVGLSSLQSASITVDGVLMDEAASNASAWTVALTAIVPAGSNFRYDASVNTGYRSSIQPIIVT